MRYSPHVGLIFDNPGAGSGGPDHLRRGGAVVKAVLPNGPVAAKMQKTGHDEVDTCSHYSCSKDAHVLVPKAVVTE